MFNNVLPDSNPRLDCDDHRPAAHCTGLSADMGWMSCETGCGLEMFGSSLKQIKRNHHLRAVNMSQSTGKRARSVLGKQGSNKVLNK